MTKPAPSHDRTVHVAKRAIQTEIHALLGLLDRIGPDFIAAVELLDSASGHVVFTGLGKSGHIARKIAATLASCGTPAFFVHATEALHGDSGVLMSGNVLVAVSNSGETGEVCAFAALAMSRGIPVLALCGNTDSSLAGAATTVLDIGVRREADELGLAPTASTTALAAMGDALACALASRRGFTAADFAARHPGGSLGALLSDHVTRRVTS